MTIPELIKKIVANSIPTVAFQAKVVSVDKNKLTCIVKMVSDDTQIEDVQLLACIDNIKDGMILFPKVGSIVLVSMVNNMLEHCFISQYSSIEEIVYQDGKNGGIPIVSELQKNFDELKKYCESLKIAISKGLNAVGTGAAASGSIGATAFETQMASSFINFSEFENKKIKH